MTEELFSINPFDGTTLNTYPIDSKAAWENKIEQSNLAQKKWTKVSVRQRSAYLKGLADYLQKNKLTLAELATKEMGKPLAQGLTEIEKSATTLNWYADNAAQMLEREMV